MRETFGVAATSWKGFDFDWADGRGARRAADDGPRQAPEGPEAPPLPRLDARAGPGSPSCPTCPPRRCPSTSPTSRRPSATTCARSPGTSRRSSRTARSASAATSPTTSSATCASSRSARSGPARRRRRFREKLAKEPLPICARCCGNYVYGKWERPGPAPARVGAAARARPPQARGSRGGLKDRPYAPSDPQNR